MRAPQTVEAADELGDSGQRPRTLPAAAGDDRRTGDLVDDRADGLVVEREEPSSGAAGDLDEHATGAQQQDGSELGLALEAAERLGVAAHHRLHGHRVGHGVLPGDRAQLLDRGAQSGAGHPDAHGTQLCAVGHVGELHHEMVTEAIDVGVVDVAGLDHDPGRHGHTSRCHEGHGVAEPHHRAGRARHERRRHRRRKLDGCPRTPRRIASEGVDGSVEGLHAACEQQAALAPLGHPRSDARGLHRAHDERDVGARCRIGERAEQRPAPALVALAGPPSEDERVDRAGVGVEHLLHQLGLRHHEAREVERVDGVTGYPLAHPRLDLGQRRQGCVDVVGEVGGERRHAAGGGDHADAADPAMPLRRQLHGELRPVEQLVDVAGGDDAVLPEREVVHPALVRDGARVRLHDQPGALGTAELERDHHLAGGLRAHDGGKERGGAAYGFDHETDHRRVRVAGEHADVVGEIAHRLVPGRHGDRHPERALLGGRHGGADEEPALRDDAHAADRGDTGDGQVEAAAREQVDLERDVLEAGAVRSNDGDAGAAGDVEQAALEVGPCVAGLGEPRRRHDHTAAADLGCLLDDRDRSFGVHQRQDGVDWRADRAEVGVHPTAVERVAPGVDERHIAAGLEHRQDCVVRHGELLVRADDGDRGRRQQARQVRQGVTVHSCIHRSSDP